MRLEHYLVGGYMRYISPYIIIIIININTYKLFLTVRGSLYFDGSTVSSEPPLRPPAKVPVWRRIRPLHFMPSFGFWTSCKIIYIL